MLLTKYFKQWLIPWSLLACLLVIVSACDDNESDPLFPRHSFVRSASAMLRHNPLGTLQMSWDKNSRELTVQLALTGLTPESIHPAHIHAGSCQNPGKVVYDLNTLQADDIGFANAITSIANVQDGIPAQSWYVNVHNGPGLATDFQHLPIACADIRPSAGVNSVVTTLGGTPEPNQSASGSVQLLAEKDRLRVTVSLQGLAANSKHDVSIHSGSCASLGRPLFSLQTLQANSTGQATSTTIINTASLIPQSGWYVNVQPSMENTSQANADSIACGDINANG